MIAHSTGLSTRRPAYAAEWNSRLRSRVSSPRATSTSPSLRIVAASPSSSSGVGSSTSETKVRHSRQAIRRAAAGWAQAIRTRSSSAQGAGLAQNGFLAGVVQGGDVLDLLLPLGDLLPAGQCPRRFANVLLASSCPRPERTARGTRGPGFR